VPEILLLPLSAIAFPNIDPVLIQIGPIAIYWYGVGYVVGILFAWWYSKRIASAQRLWGAGGSPVTPAHLDDFVLWAAVGIVAGGRIGYILFYDLARYIESPTDIFRVWEGGMSFHGGLLGVIIAMILFARKNHIPVFSMFDVVSAGVPVGLGLVRVANFINSELWGRPTDVAWGVIFPNGGPEPRHPSQLYEAGLEGIVLFLALAWLVWRAGALKRPGIVCGVFVGGYGLARTFVEFFREPDAHIGYLAGGWLTMGMILSLPMVLIGFGTAIWAANRKTA
jgi:phosphatidylglycerol---prolipoprotein diacylglyceryl transferase